MAQLFVQACALGSARISKGNADPVSWGELPKAVRNFRFELKPDKIFRISRPGAGFLITADYSETTTGRKGRRCALAARNLAFHEVRDEFNRTLPLPIKWAAGGPNPNDSMAVFPGFSLSFTVLRDGTSYVETLTRSEFDETE